MMFTRLMEGHVGTSLASQPSIQPLGPGSKLACAEAVMVKFSSQKRHSWEHPVPRGKLR
jgi:hypothetical protein